jgi:putative flavoprotein involved in K+ transport
MEQVGVLVIGAGPGGLAVSHELSAVGVPHVVVERDRVAASWRGRWDSFCLVTPNWTIAMPGGEYRGAEPDGFLPRDQLVAHFERYAASLAVPVREGVEVTSLERSGSGLRARTPAGELAADQVVVCTGSYSVPYLPPTAASLPADLLVIDATGYRRPDALPPGAVLVVGSGQTGGQIAEELVRSGRDVVLSCGKAPYMPRWIDGRDGVWWARESGVLDQTAASLPGPEARFGANFLNSGARGGHDLNLRVLRALGVRLVGHFLGAEGRSARFARDLAETVAWGDARYLDLRRLFERLADERGMPPPGMPDPEPFDDPGDERIDLDGFAAVIFTSGFRPDYGAWIRHPDAFDRMGFPIQQDGASAVVPGLYFVGIHFQRKRKSATLVGFGEDAAIVAGAIAAQRRAARAGDATSA